MSDDDYVKYVSENIRPGVRVRRLNSDCVCSQVKQGEVGVVTQVEGRDVYADWEKAGRNVYGGGFVNMQLLN